MSVIELNFYLFIFYSLTLLTFAKSRITTKLFIVIITIQFALVNGLRHFTVGIDTIRYERKFQSLSSDTISGISEIGYEVAQKLFLLFSDNFNFWLLSVAVFVFSLLGLVIYKYSKNYFISYLLFIGLGFFNFSFTGIRQTIAIILVLFSFKYILDKKFMKFFIIILIAATFHYAAIIFLPIYYIAQIRWNYQYILYLIGSYILLFLLRAPIGELLTLLFYEENSLDRYTSSDNIGGLAILILIVIILGIYVYSPIKYNSRENTILANIMVIAFFIQSLSSFSYLFTRLNMFFFIFIILYIPHIINNLDKLPVKLTIKETKVIKLLITMIIILAVSYYYINNLESDGNGIVPYYFFWEY
ncbi:EpsG family protein [Gracilibacillus lacisalsi]|uniref:EpsG family protein n=1 Tax=Gracilibacillus lacisalsi TaxID=393087 RepID=UPI00037F182C|nr:EpsG family protein [Gracilibacillus lacisalsi]